METKASVDCYILAREGDQYQFVKVQGEMVDIGFEITAFAYNSEGHGNPLEFWNVFDLETGRRLGETRARKEEALELVRGLVAKAGLESYREQQEKMSQKYGKSPAVE